MIYLDNAATSYPKPESIYQKLGSFLKEQGANPGRSGYRMAANCEKMIDDTRYLITQFFNGNNPERLIFGLNTTDVLNIAIKGVLKKGDHVVTTTLEHNSISRSLNRLEKEGFISLSRIEHSQEGFINPDILSEKIREETRLVAITHASNVLGTIQPINDIGDIVSRSSAIFLLDAAQTAGVIPIDINEMKIDLLAFPGHKGLLGPTGTGCLYVSDKIDLTPFREGGTGGDSSSAFQPEHFPFILEGGTPNTLGIAGLTEGIKYVQNRGIENILRHEHRLIELLINCLLENDKIKIYGSHQAKDHVGTLSCNVEGVSPMDVSMILDQSFNIAVRSGLHCSPYTHKINGTFPEGTVRISPGVFTTEDDIIEASKALNEISVCVAV